jgi:hypothetical protein
MGADFLAVKRSRDRQGYLIFSNKKRRRMLLLEWQLALVYMFVVSRHSFVLIEIQN